MRKHFEHWELKLEQAIRWARIPQRPVQTPSIQTAKQSNFETWQMFTSNIHQSCGKLHCQGTAVSFSHIHTHTLDLQLGPTAPFLLCGCLFLGHSVL